jgi:hypothetical protein
MATNRKQVQNLTSNSWRSETGVSGSVWESGGGGGIGGLIFR